MCRWNKSIETLDSIRFTKSDVMCKNTKRQIPRLLDKLKTQIQQIKRKDAKDADSSQ